MQQLKNGLTPELEEIFDKFLKDNPQPTFLFRLIEAGEHRIPVQTAEGVENTVFNPSRHVHGSTKIRTATGHQLNLVYSESQEEKTVNGVVTLTDRPESIWFDQRSHCIVTVKRTEREKLIRLLFSDQCRNSINPSADTPDGGYVYELVQTGKKIEQQVANQDRVLDAQIAVRQATDSEVMLACERLELATSPERAANVAALYVRAGVDPDGVFRVLGDEWDKTTALVRDLTTAGVIAFDEAGRAYKTVSDQKPFHNVLTGNQETSLIKYLSDSQGQKTKTALSKLLEEKAKKGGKR